MCTQSCRSRIFKLTGSCSGDVPGFKDKLEKGMLNFFRRVKPEAPVLRNNYFIQVDDELAWSSSIGSEDALEGIGWFTAEKNKAIHNHYFRSERQSLRRCAFRPPFVHILEVIKSARLTFVLPDCLAPEASFLQSALISTPSLTFAPSRMCLAVWRRRCVAGMITSAITRARSGTVTCCSSIWTRCTRSRLLRAWNWIRRRRLGCTRTRVVVIAFR